MCFPIWFAPIFTKIEFWGSLTLVRHGSPRPPFRARLGTPCKFAAGCACGGTECGKPTRSIPIKQSMCEQSTIAEQSTDKQSSAGINIPHVASWLLTYPNIFLVQVSKKFGIAQVSHQCKLNDDLQRDLPCYVLSSLGRPRCYIPGRSSDVHARIWFSIEIIKCGDGWAAQQTCSGIRSKHVYLHTCPTCVLERIYI